MAELREKFLFAYGSTGTHGATSDRIWPFTKLGEAEQKEIMARLNGEELLAGPLRTLAKSKILRSGAAPNIFFTSHLRTSSCMPIQISNGQTARLFRCELSARERVPAETFLETPPGPPGGNFRSGRVRSLPALQILPS